MQRKAIAAQSRPSSHRKPRQCLEGSHILLTSRHYKRTTPCSLSVRRCVNGRGVTMTFPTSLGTGRTARWLALTVTLLLGPMSEHAAGIVATVTHQGGQ